MPNAWDFKSVADRMNWNAMMIHIVTGHRLESTGL